MVQMDDEIADAERCEFGEESVGALAALLAADKALAEDVLFGEQADRVGGETVVEREDDEGYGADSTRLPIPVRVVRSGDTPRGGVVPRGVATWRGTRGNGGWGETPWLQARL
jgi:hypothetical protein